MNSIEQNLVMDASNLTLEPMTAALAMPQAPKLGALDSLRRHWPEYLMEAALLQLARTASISNLFSETK